MLMNELSNAGIHAGDVQIVVVEGRERGGRLKRVLRRSWWLRIDSHLIQLRRGIRCKGRGIR